MFHDICFFKVKDLSFINNEGKKIECSKYPICYHLFMWRELDSEFMQSLVNKTFKIFPVIFLVTKWKGRDMICRNGVSITIFPTPDTTGEF